MQYTAVIDSSPKQLATFADFDAARTWIVASRQGGEIRWQEDPCTPLVEYIPAPVVVVTYAATSDLDQFGQRPGPGHPAQFFEFTTVQQAREWLASAGGGTVNWSDEKGTHSLSVPAS